MTHKALSKSVRSPLPGYHAISSADPDQAVEITLILKRQKEISAEEIIALNKTTPTERTYKTHQEVSQEHGASAQDLQTVVAFAHEHGLAVVDQDLASRTVKLSGTVAALQKAFGVDLKIYENGTGKRYRGRTGPIYVPENLGTILQGVHGLDDRDQSETHFRIIQKSHLESRRQAQGFSPVDIAQAYDFPDSTGEGETIAIIELGGGFRTTDLQRYFSQNGANPRIFAVSVDGATNNPTGDPNGPDGEVVLDIEVAGAIAKKANLVVYFAPNTDKGFLDAITAAVHDQEHKPSVISISWGGPEISFTPQSMEAFNEVFKDAALLGITVLVAAGDDGSDDGVGDNQDHVDFPASSPFVLACGGTRLITRNGQIDTEKTWGGVIGNGATGGGQSAHFPRPSYQNGVIPAAFTFRGLPDVAGDADPQTGYNVLVDGIDSVIGGTSAVAPLYAGLIAQINERLNTRCGFLNPFLYAHGSEVCRDVIEGTNGTHHAAVGWDATTGFGSFKGNTLLKKLQISKAEAA